MSLPVLCCCFFRDDKTANRRFWHQLNIVTNVITNRHGESLISFPNQRKLKQPDGARAFTIDDLYF